MPITATQKEEIQHILDALLQASVPFRKGKRHLADMFLELVDPGWVDYYEVIPEPRCLNGIKDNLAKNKYKNPLVVYEDLMLVFLNALYYNEEGSQIAKDAATLKDLAETQWRQSPSLPPPPASQSDKPTRKKKESTPLPVPPPAQPDNRTPPKIRLAPVLPKPVPVSTPAPAPAPVLTPAPQPQEPVAGPSSSPMQGIQTQAQTPTAPQPSRPPSQPQPHPQPPSSPDRPSTPDMDVDIGGTPEPEDPGQGEGEGEGDRDGESDAIVRQLERGLPRWEGFADVGWSGDISQGRMVEIVSAVKEFKDANGARIAATIEALPEETTIPDLSFSTPLSLAMIETRAREQAYGSSEAFDREMSNLFLKARRSYDPATEPYGHVLHLQRLYHALTSPTPPSLPVSPSPTHFAALHAGPGSARPLHSPGGVPGVTVFRVPTKDRTFVDVLRYKGWEVRLADWVHLSNPDDPGRPVVGQVFKCWVSDEVSKKGQPGITVCWYFRPEQTFHPASRQFWENEVFKTSHFADHPLPDIIEKIACQFTARHIRGRPRPPFWYPSWPLYVCHSRYNDRERVFVRIKNWNSCVPEEVRKSQEFMPIYPFERTVYPRKVVSPFLGGGAKGVPGGIGEALERAEGEKVEGGGTGRKRPKRNVGAGKAAAAAVTPASAMPQTYTVQPQFQVPTVQQSAGQDRSIVSALGGMAALANNASLERLSPETTKHFDRDPETNELLWFASPPVDMAHIPAPTYSLAYLHHLAKKRKLSSQDGSGETESPEGKKKTKTTTTSGLGRSMSERVEMLLAEHGLQ
ncbi:hypothetical protein BXZ70DRAFT_932819 [Cristinia sonorae]|uniref:Uncharacterized protein n=1 Tax=Cristinia sonorae TaxID=1940300 RepID=A0A8K0UQP4_9AGAR|nr:hypothetical protein BXZ70DRAFT_932819 [Cristinia sonorae]